MCRVFHDVVLSGTLSGVPLCFCLRDTQSPGEPGTADDMELGIKTQLLTLVLHTGKGGVQERSSTAYQTQKVAGDCHSHVHGLLLSHSHDHAHDDHLSSHKSSLRSHPGLSSKSSPNCYHPHEINVGHSEHDEVYRAPGRSPDFRRGLSLLCPHLPLRLSPTPSWVVAWEGLQVPRCLLLLRPIMKPLWPIMKTIILAAIRGRGPISQGGQGPNLLHAFLPRESSLIPPPPLSFSQGHFPHGTQT